MPLSLSNFRNEVFKENDVKMSKEHERLHGYGMEGVAFGLADGIVCFLGIIIGVAEATLDVRLVVITGIVGGIADALGNSIGFFISQSTERGAQIHSLEEHGENVRVHSHREVWMSGVLSFVATIAALVILIVPFLFLNLSAALVSTFVIGILVLFFLGRYVGKMGGENPLKTGLKYAALGVAGAVVSYFVGDSLKHLTGILV